MILDQEYRDIARRILDHNVCVEAGAGTGKTSLLTDRLLFVLLAGGRGRQGVDIGRVAAMTFTEKAAGEIKVRLAERLTDIISVIDGRSIPEGRQSNAVDWLMEAKQYFKRTPPQIRQAAEAALTGLDRAHIGTLHSFAASLLRMYPLQAGVDPRFEVDPGEVRRQLFESEWLLWLDGELGTKPPRASYWLEVLAWSPLEDLRDLAWSLAGEEAAEARLGPSQGMKDRLKKMYDEFKRLPLGKPDPGGNSKILDSFPRLTAHLQALVQVSESPPAPLSSGPVQAQRKEPPRKWPKAWEGLEGEALYKEALSLAGDTSSFAETLLRKAVDLVRPFADAFRTRHVQGGFLGFDGLVIKARALVRDNPEVRRELKQRFEAILVDEFQDTDPVQGELLLFLAEDPGASASRWQDIRFEAGKLFLVGDPKQSIYRFRGADIRAYQRFTQLVLQQGGMRCALQTNFRSHRGLVEPVNAIFDAVMKEEKDLQPGYSRLHPRPGGENPASPSVELVLAGSGSDAEDISAPDAQRAQARWMAWWIAEKCGPAEAGGERAAKQFRYRDVAVLLRSATPLPVYLEVFKESQIPYVVESDRRFYAAQEVLDFLNLLKALDDPHDGIAVVGLLRSPLVGMEDREIYILGQAGGLDYSRELPPDLRLPDTALQRLKAFFSFLKGFRGRVGREPLGDLIAGLLRDSFLFELCGAAYYGEQTLSNLAKFGRMAAAACDGKGATLKEFISVVSRSVEESMEEGESSLADEQLDAVRILTIHKAKGLEYPVVMVPNLSASAGNGQGARDVCRLDWEDGVAGLRLPRARAADIAMSFIEKAEERREEKERVRLLYVALTRAREKLILLGKASGGDKTSFSAILSAAGAWPKKGETPDEILLLDGSRVPVSRVSPEGAGLMPQVLRPDRSARSMDGSSLAALWKRRREFRDGQAGALTFDTPTRALKENEKLTADSSQDVGVAGVSSLVGQVCHRVLEEWDYRKVDDLTDRIARAYQVLKQRYPVAYWSPVARESEKVLEEFLASPIAVRLGQCEILGREIPFLYGAREAVMRGSIDLVFRESGRLWVADYKTDRISAKQAASHAQKYERQGRAYVEAVERSLGERCGFQVIFLRLGSAVELIK